METIMLIKKENEVFEILLHSSASSGFVWKLSSLSDGIELVDKKIESGEKDNSVGNPSNDTFRFIGKKKGEFEIKFELGRAWEQNSINQVVYKLTII